MSRRVIILVLLLVGVITAGLYALLIVYPKISHNASNSYTQPLVDQSTLDGLEKKNASTASIVHIADGLLPPTNSWMSGMVLQATPLPVYPFPHSFLAKDNGFEIGLPRVQSTADAIIGSHTSGLSASIADTTRFRLTRYDKLSATLTYSNDDMEIGKLTVSQGSPFVFYRALESSSLSISDVEGVVAGSSRSYLRYNKAGMSYVLVAHSGAKIQRRGATVQVTAPKNSLVTVYSLPGDGKDTLQAFAGNELRSVEVSHTQNDTSSMTTFKYKTTNDQLTVFVPLPYTHTINAGTVLASYDSIYGPSKAYQGARFMMEVPMLTPSNTLDLSHLTSAHKTALIDSLKQDVEGTHITEKDSYFGGKQLARAATLLDISEQLGQTETSNRLKLLLNEAFALRLSTDSFYYDATLHGIAATTKSFGSEDFNDHHFHYGYIIYAASILGRYDKDFISEYKKQINLLVADIASYNTREGFVLQRNYDPYSAHSWAAGLAPFADGNNQESSSEAINAWNGVAKWSQLINNSDLEMTAKWMLSNEAATAARAWRKVDTSSPYLHNYSSPIVSLGFSGKRTYATFFSNDPSAKLGIQLLPMSPVMASFVGDGTTIDTSIAASIQDNTFNGTLGDYVLLYLALRNPQKAAALLHQQTTLDDGNSQTYMKAWIFGRVDAAK